MSQSLALVTFLVRDYDEAIVWFTRTLGWALLEDTRLDDAKRWVRVAPPDVRGARAAPGAALLLARAATDEQRASVGRQGGGRVAFFLETDDLARDHAAWSARGVEFTEAPRDEAYGRVVVFRDLYGNRWDLIERARG